MKTRITELLNIDYPIFQGGMAWVADGDLAGAVSKAGGLGIIGGGNAPVSYTHLLFGKLFIRDCLTIPISLPIRVNSFS